MSQTIKNSFVILTRYSFSDAMGYKKQGQIHGYPSRVRVGRSSAGEGHKGIWAGAICSKS